MVDEDDGLDTSPDFNVTTPGKAAVGNVSTNDLAPANVTYGTPVANGGNPNATVPTMSSNGGYTFTNSTPGVYKFLVPVCLEAQTSGCATESLTITVLDVNITTNPPAVDPDVASVTGADTSPPSVTINVRVNDGPGNLDGTLGTPEIPTQPANGTATVNGSGNVVYTPNAGFYGEDVVTYKVCESTSTLCGTATIVITVLRPGVPNTLIASDDYKSTTPNTTLTVNVANGVLANDFDPNGDVLTVNAQTTTVSAGKLTLETTGSYSFVPATNYVGPASFIYTVCDGNSCKTATLHILVTDVVTVLPVTLASFTASKESSVANLSWTTTAETNSDFFEIQHSSDAKSWDILGKVKANGESKITRTYSFSHSNPLSGTNLYRLRMVDKDASYSFSRVRSLNFEGSDVVTLYPNPVSSVLKVRTGNWADVKEIGIADLNGRWLYKANKPVSDEIQVSNLPAGIYLVKVTKMNGSVSIHKIIVNR